MAAAVFPPPLARLFTATFKPRSGWWRAGWLLPCLLWWGGVTAPAADLHSPLASPPPVWTNSPPATTAARPALLKLALGLPLRQPEVLAQLLADLYTPGHPRFRHFLTPAEFTAQFGPTEADYESVVAFAQSRGLLITGRHANRLVVEAQGPTALVERAFHVRVGAYSHPSEARNFFAPDRAPAWELATPLLSVAGLDNFVVPRPHLRTQPADGVTPQVTGSGPVGFFIGNDFRRAYAPGTPLNGAGQYVGLLEFNTGYYPADVTAYLQLAGLPKVPLTTVLLDGFNGAPGTGNDEVSLDIDMAIAMAPGLSGVIVYEGELTDSILNRMATDNTAKQLSASWTYPIDATSLQIFQEFAAQGQSFFNSSGDSGAYAPGSVASPTDVPYVTTVGGTDLTTQGGGGPWVAETTWTGSSGGYSSTYAIPAWQVGANSAANQGSSVFRNLPDVAMLATNCWLIYNNGLNAVSSGTSISSPLWAGFTALANQLAAANGQPPVGFLNPTLYAFGAGSNAYPAAALFHDITTGNNKNAGSPTRFSAGTGYDLCTGWGTPTGTNLLQALALPEALHVTPAAGALFSGPPGGPITPATFTLGLTNGYGAALNWSLVNTAAWCSVSVAAGSLAPGQGTNVVISPAPAAVNLPAGNYPANLVVSNLTDASAQIRPVTLAFYLPPVITTQPTNETVLESTTASFAIGTAPNALQTFQWRSNNLNVVDGGRLSGSTTPALALTGVTLADGNSAYAVVVSTPAGVVTSAVATLTVTSSPPVIVLQPTNQNALPGQAVRFAVAVAGHAPFTYHWQLNGTNLPNGAGFGGSTTPTLTISNVVQGGAYTVVIGNALGSVTSQAAVLTVPAVTIPGVTLTTPYSFTGGAGGVNPYAPLAPGKLGNYYGTTYGDGGRTSDGTVFRFNTNGTITTLASFTGTTGAGPYAGLVLGRDGNYYGATAAGGAYSQGLVFRLSSGGALTTLATLNNENGGSPFAGLVQGVDGFLYGTTGGGGAYGFGTIYRMSTSGALTTVVAFDNQDGATPSPVLIQATDGNFYGTTAGTGATGSYGTVFRLTPGGALTTLHAYANGTDGATPIAGVVQAADGNLYGVTVQGGAKGAGTVFRLTLDGQFNTLHAFTAGIDGANPWGGLVAAPDGNLYGTTQGAGTYGFGTVFRFAPNGPLTTVAQFDGYNGKYPSAALLPGPDGKLYGTTVQGGAAGYGAVFALAFGGPVQITGQPADQIAYLGGNATFSVATAGAGPLGYQWQVDGVNLTDGGNVAGSATPNLQLANVAFTDSALYTVIVSNAYGAVTSAPAVLAVTLSPPRITNQPASLTVVAGTTATFVVGATGEMPLTYQWQLGGTNLTDGGAISGATNNTLVLAGVPPALAGTYSVIVSNALAVRVSTPASLTVVAPTPAGLGLTTLRTLTGGSDGAFPYAGLVQGRDGNLYGVCAEGGSAFRGTVFRLTTAGVYSTLVSFPAGSAGASPEGKLAQSPAGVFYAPTFMGGAANYGTVFRLNGASLSYAYAFTNGVDGANPYAGLLFGANGVLYGTAAAGGSHSNGVAFSLTTNGVLTPLYEFGTAGAGAYPYGALVQAPSGLLYGTTLEGGLYGYGTVFCLATNGTLTNLLSFNGAAQGAYPGAGVVFGPDGNLYGTTLAGGSGGQGTVFRLTPAGGLTVLVNFQGTNGSAPSAELLLASDGNFYGTTSAGGWGGQGTVFQMTINGALTTLLWFDGSNGAAPQGALLQANDGRFYGTTPFGGTGFNPSAGGGYGLIYQLTVPLFPTNSLTLPPAIAGLAYSTGVAGFALAPAGDPLTFTKISGPAWLQVAPNGTLGGTPAATDLGQGNCVISLTDPNGFTAAATFTIPVNPDPAPVFLANPFTTPAATAGAAYTANLATNATDAEIAAGDVLTFLKSGGPAWLNVATNGVLSGTPGAGDIGTNQFLITAVNLGGATTTATLNLLVNGGPFFIAGLLSYPAATVGLPYAGSIATNALDPFLAPGGTLAFSLVSGPAWLQMGADGTLSGTPTAGNLGTNTFAAQVQDSAGYSATAQLILLVGNNHPPVFAANPFAAPSAPVGLAYVAGLGAAVSDPDFGDLTTLAKVTGPAWLAVAPAGQLSGTPAITDLGTNVFQITATDLLGASTGATLQIVVENPLTLQITPTGGQWQLLWTGGLPPYQVQSSGSLLPGSWTNLGGPTSGYTLFLSPTNPAAYYRVSGW